MKKSTCTINVNTSTISGSNESFFPVLNMTNIFHEYLSHMVGGIIQYIEYK